MPNRLDQFNIVIKGVGGQGLITVLQIIAEAALFEGYDVRTSELHGLSQRGGSVEVHIRFGKKIYSPLIAQGRADLIFGLEMQEALRGIYFANKKTNFLVNKQITPIPLEKPFSEKELLDIFKKYTKNVIVIPASDICREKLGTDVVSGVYLLSLAVLKGLVPLRPNSILKAIKKIIPEKYLELNLKTFNLASKNA
jgi:indolepyruvate ferredoxin oxidoreductase beta subunit